MQETEVEIASESVPAQLISLSATDFQFEPKALSAKAGAASFVVRNTGVLEHNFVVESAPYAAVGAINSIPVGISSQLELTLNSGSYAIVCTLPGHREAGMVGTLAVAP